MNVYEKLNVIQTQLKAPKNQYNAFGGFYHRNLEDILEALKPLLKNTKACVLLSDKSVLIGDWHYIEATATFIDAESGEKVEVSAVAREDAERKKMDNPQITGSASSYARKYALGGLFAVDDNKDPDATDTGDNGGKKAQTTQDNAQAVYNDKKKAVESMIDEYVIMTNHSDEDIINAVLKKLKIDTPYEVLTLDELQLFGNQLNTWIKKRKENNGG